MQKIEMSEILLAVDRAVIADTENNSQHNQNELNVYLINININACEQ